MVGMLSSGKVGIINKLNNYSLRGHLINEIRNWTYSEDAQLLYTEIENIPSALNIL